ncbi:MAG: ribonuclease H-like domain-containing protein [Lachnospiraceae bacterium]|nr:ribonuclease H-like domain-containing protein [Lachnospiraceae bacterium]
MQIIKKLYEGYVPLYPLDGFCDTKKALFIDIETTGLKKESTSLYLIGCGNYTDEGYQVTLFFADDESEECEILKEFVAFIGDFSDLFHFNGIKFDIPYLEYKAKLYGLGDIFAGHGQTDIYRLCAPLRYLLFPESMRQKAIEAFLGIKRDDMYNGGELIDVYKRYVYTQSSDDLELLITHNCEDVLGMHLIMPILYYLDLADAPLKYIDYRIHCYEDYNGDHQKEVIFTFNTTVKIPRSFNAKTETMYLKVSADSGDISIRLPIYTGRMKVFFDNYRDYRYIPEEDTVIPVSLAQTLPKDRYQKATRENCCQNVTGEFVKQPGTLFTPVLKTSYKDKKRYFRFPDCFNKEAAEQFGRELINVFFTKKRR